MSGGRFVRDICIVAGQELSESVRTKRAILLTVLFCGATVAGTLMFIKLLASVEEQLVGVLGLDAGAAGGATAALWKSDMFRQTIVHLVGDRDLAQSLLQFTPLGLFYGWLSFAIVPWLVAFTSSSRITEEIWSGSARFVLTRTTRIAWVLGKYVGQALQLLCALLLTVFAAWLTGYLKLESFPGAATFRDMLLFAPKAWIYGLCFLGLVSGISLFCKSPGIANVLGLIGFLLTSGAWHLAHRFAGEGWRRILDVVQIVLPRQHYQDLMRPDWGHALPATIFLVALGLCYLFAGYLWLQRKDL